MRNFANSNNDNGAQIQASRQYTYPDIVRLLTDMEAIAVKPHPEEFSGQFSSYDRRSIYNVAEDIYVEWDANHDFLGYLRDEPDGGKVLAEMTGPGYITRIWSANPGTGHIKLFIDDNEEAVIDLPFIEFFRTFQVYDQLSYVAARGYNCYVPITYNKYCKVVAYDEWGAFFHINYTTLRANDTVEPFAFLLGNTQEAALAKVQASLAKSLGTHPTSNEKEQTCTGRATIEPGKTANLWRLEGNQAITGICLKVLDLTPDEEWQTLRELTIQAYWDGQQEAAIWAPIGDFFGSAAGYNPYHAVPMGMREDGWMYSHWYMPFAREALFQAANDGQQPRQIEFTVTFAPLPRSETDYLRFHAKWMRVADPDPQSDRWPDTPILKTTGAGRFLGFMLHNYKANNLVDPQSKEGGAWWGEGDEKFFIDGEKFPSWFGTGTEDYFGYAWGDAALFSKPFHTQPYNSGGIKFRGNKVLNRFQVIDHIPFQRSFEGFLEKYYRDEYARYAGVSYWYLEPGGMDPYVPLPLAARTDYYEQYPSPATFYKGEDVFVESLSAGTIQAQAIEQWGNGWYADQHLWWRNAEGNDELNLYINLPGTGEYALHAQFTMAPDYAKITLLLDHQPFGGEFNAYAERVQPSGNIVWDERSITAGTHLFTIKVTGKDEHSTGFCVGLDYLDFKLQNTLN